MAINIPIITSLEDKGIKAAQAAFSNFKTSVAGAEGGMNKFKAGAGAALDAVKANAASFAMAGGAALVSFATKGIKAFQELALSAGKFSDATGLAVEDASRYLEVAGDLAIPIEAVSSAIGRLNKTIGADPDKVRDLGVDLVYLAGGSLDVNATFLNTIDLLNGIKDPAERAQVATQLLGKGWQSLSEIIVDGSGKLKASLNSVSGTQVITAAELRRAKDYRDAQDALADSFEKLKITIGENLVPALVPLIEKLSALSGAEAPGGGSWFGHAIDASTLWANSLMMGPVRAMGMYQKESDNSVIATGDLWNSIMKMHKDAFPKFTNEINKTTEALINADTAWKVLTDSLEEEVALDQAKIQLEELEAAAAKAFGSGAQADIDAYEQAALDFVTALSAIAGGMDKISQKEILIRFKTQGPAAAIELARWIARGAEYGGLSAVDALNLAGISTLPARAMGGPVAPGGSYLVGERGPELFTPSSSGNITANSSLGGGANITVNVQGADPNAVVAALQRYVRISGPVPVNIRNM